MKGKLTPEKRIAIEKLVLEVVRRLDNKKMLNYNRYREMFRIMKDDEFETWANSMGHDLDDTIQMIQLPFEEMRMSQIKDAANFLNIPLEEYVYYRHNDPRGVRTKMKVPVGYVHIKRVQQLLAKKNRYTFDNEQTDLKSGQVKGDSKVASISDAETFALSAIDAQETLKEFLGPRADNQHQKIEMYKQIMRDGYTSFSEMTEDKTKSTTINTVNTYLLASGIHSDILSKSLKTNYTIDKELEKK